MAYSDSLCVYTKKDFFCLKQSKKTSFEHKTGDPFYAELDFIDYPHILNFKHYYKLKCIVWLDTDNNHLKQVFQQNIFTLKNKYIHFNIARFNLDGHLLIEKIDISAKSIVDLLQEKSTQWVKYYDFYYDLNARRFYLVVEVTNQKKNLL